ncbi:biotin transporter BioY [Butyricicoccus porcorum]|uniref:Biotin transporter n=1 Tax=Butyricicoccus porcorum TaxID=1945634 RepID=A0A252F5B6_9FIRM|nr:biotin transporter BioY [Butyricicoccus porcorum]MDY4484427.1 biotin transporter BioY [Butyricicoccus porcorum]OUM20954.1 biotin transporter BioY [Butyricicoccus porcorum]
MEQKKTKTNVREMALIAVMAAVTCVLGPLSVPIGVVPISFTNLAVYLAIYVLGCKRGTISYIVYLLIGLVGVPVFSSFTGGVGKLFGPTGGYLIGFIFMALICGWFIDKFDCKLVPSFVGMVLGTIVCYVFGTVWLAYQAGMSFYAALAAGVLPFIIGDLVKMVIAAVIGPQVRRQLARAGLTTK